VTTSTTKVRPRAELVRQRQSSHKSGGSDQSGASEPAGRSPSPLTVGLSIPPLTFSGAVISSILLGLLVGPIGVVLGFFGGGFLGHEGDRLLAMRH